MREAVKEFPTGPVVDDLPPVAAEAIQYSRRSTQVPASADSAEIVSNMICIIMSAQWPLSVTSAPSRRTPLAASPAWTTS